MCESSKTMTNTRMHMQFAIPTVLSERHSKSFRNSSSTCRSPFQQYFQSAIPTVLSERHSNSTFRAPFQQYFQSAIPTVLSERHSRSFPTSRTQKPSRNLYSYMAWVRVVVISLCIMLLCIMLCSGCSRVQFL